VEPGSGDDSCPGQRSGIRDAEGDDRDSQDLEGQEAVTYSTGPTLNGLLQDALWAAQRDSERG
jgi:hypothetical protein